MKPFTFISIPRTGTNSVRKSLGLVRTNSDNHQPTRAMRDVLGPREWDRRFTFSFVRNPYSRLVSWFAFCKKLAKQGTLPADARKLYLTASFSQWVLDGCPHHFNAVRFHGVNPLSLCDYLLDEKGNVMVDFVGRVENFNADFAVVCKKLGVPTPTLKHVNKSKHAAYRNYYRVPAVRKAADKMLARDCEVFGYGL